MGGNQRRDTDRDHGGVSGGQRGAAGDRRGSLLLAVALAVVGGLLLTGATTGAWVVTEITQEVGDVPLVQEQTVPGLALAPAALPLGLSGVLAGVLLLLPRRRVRQGLAGLLMVVGAGGLATAALGLARATGEPGDVGAAAYVAITGAALLVIAGAASLRPSSPPRLSARYDLDADVDHEWRLASADESEPPD